MGLPIPRSPVQGPPPQPCTPILTRQLPTGCWPVCPGCSAPTADAPRGCGPSPIPSFHSSPKTLPRSPQAPPQGASTGLAPAGDRTRGALGARQATTGLALASGAPGRIRGDWADDAGRGGLCFGVNHPRPRPRFSQDSAQRPPALNGFKTE